MTHVVMIDDTKNSLTEGMESVPVTAVETPAVRAAAVLIRATPSGERHLQMHGQLTLTKALERQLRFRVKHRRSSCQRLRAWLMKARSQT
ncbi:MAG: hypothetical protein R2741_15190 [Methanolobus sp.]